MNTFAAIDFETANNHRTSVCSVGVVIVRDCKIVDSFYSLIRPEPNFYNYWNTRVHGLTQADTNGAPLFPDVWRQIEPLIEGLPLVAHNSPFDEGCLKAVMRCYGMDYPNYEFHCTCRAARKHFDHQLPNHQLHTVAEACGYHLANHHHALADAEACAWITPPQSNRPLCVWRKALRGSGLLFGRVQTNSLVYGDFGGILGVIGW